MPPEPNGIATRSASSSPPLLPASTATQNEPRDGLAMVLWETRLSPRQNWNQPSCSSESQRPSCERAKATFVARPVRRAGTMSRG